MVLWEDLKFAENVLGKWLTKETYPELERQVGNMDRIADMLTTIKNAGMAGRKEANVIHSNECESVANVLKERGFLNEVKVYKEKDKSYKMIHLGLAFDEFGPKLTVAKKVSKPGRRVYKPSADLHKVAAGLGVMVVSTSRGIMSAEEAKKKKLGGEVICEVK